MYRRRGGWREVDGDKVIVSHSGSDTRGYQCYQPWNDICWECTMFHQWPLRETYIYTYNQSTEYVTPYYRDIVAYIRVTDMWECEWSACTSAGNAILKVAICKWIWSKALSMSQAIILRHLLDLFSLNCRMLIVGLKSIKAISHQKSSGGWSVTTDTMSPT